MESYYDLHTHSCLSPCADDDMTVNNIANMAMLCGLDIVALTDHNTLKNCPAFFRACERAGVIPIAGTELCTREEVHVLCLFPSLETGMRFDGYVEKLMPEFMNNPRIFGRQLVLNENDEIIGEEPKLLISACDIGILDLPALVRGYGGVAVPSHIERPSNSILSNLGYIWPEYEFTCYEVKDGAVLPELISANPALSKVRIIYNSDAHTLVDINERIHSIELPDKSAPALIEALLSAPPA